MSLVKHNSLEFFGLMNTFPGSSLIKVLIGLFRFVESLKDVLLSLIEIRYQWLTLIDKTFL